MFRVANVRFRLNRRGIAACAVGPELRKACHLVVVDKALPFAKSIAPERSSRKHKHYADSFTVEDGLMFGYPADWPMTRAMSRLLNTSRHATVVEVGAEVTLNGRIYPIAGHYVLQQTLEFLHATKDLT